MAIVKIINNGQKMAIHQIAYHNNVSFNVIEDGNGDFIVSEEEFNQKDNLPQFNFLNPIPFTTYIPAIGPGI